MIAAADSPQDRTALRPVTPIGIAAAAALAVRDSVAAGQLDADIVAKANEVVRILQGLEQYVEDSTTGPSDALAQLATATARGEWEHSDQRDNDKLESEMLSGHAAGRLLQFLVRSTRATSALDIGMFTGYSALAMAEALPANGHVVACEYDRGIAEFAQAAFAKSPSGSKIEVRVGDATQSLRELTSEGRHFDVIFLDADKPGYGRYYELLLDGDLLPRDGVLCVDNTLMQGEPYSSDAPSENGQAIADFNRMVQQDSRVEQVLVPLRDGITLIRRIQ
ncbi:MAG: class I SAM-dependent methyltransferase [Planctomycetota bacterium]